MIKSDTLTAPISTILLCSLCLTGVPANNIDLEYDSFVPSYYDYSCNRYSSNNEIADMYYRNENGRNIRAEVLSLFGRQEGFTKGEYKKYNSYLKKESVKIGINIFS